MSKSTYNRRKKLGLCPICGIKNTGRFTYCEDCRRKKSEYNYKKRISGICRLCGEKVNSEKWLCEKCSIKQNDYRRMKLLERKKNNLCTRCGSKEKVYNYSYCDECNMYFKQLRADRIRFGICTVCGKNDTDGKHKLCIDCRLKSRNKLK